MVVENKEPESSTSSGDEGADQVTEASPTSGDEGVEKTSLLDVVNDTLSTDAEVSPSSEDDSGKADGEEDAPADGDAQNKDSADPEGEEELGDVTPQELEGYHSKTRRRIKGLLQERDGAREEAEGLREKAGRLDSFLGRVTDMGLSGDEIDQGLGLMSLLNKAQSDQKAANEAAELIGSIHAQLQQMTGASLPAELQQKVDQGYITPDLAGQLAASQQASQMAERRQQAAQQEEQQRAQQTNFGDIQTSVSQWEAGWKRRDADYAVKMPIVESQIKAALSEAYIAGEQVTPEKAKSICDEALKASEQIVVSLRPVEKPKPVDPGFAASGAPRAKEAPKSIRDVVDQALAG